MNLKVLDMSETGNSDFNKVSAQELPKRHRRNNYKVFRNLAVLDRKDKKHFLEMLKGQFGFEEKLDYIFFINNKNKIYIVNKDLAAIDFSKLRLNSVGLYIAEQRNDEARLSIEGSQMIGPLAKRNVIEITRQEAREWLKGKDLEKEVDTQGFVIIRSEDDYLGCGRVSKGKILPQPR